MSTLSGLKRTAKMNWKNRNEATQIRHFRVWQCCKMAYFRQDIQIGHFDYVDHKYYVIHLICFFLSTTTKEEFKTSSFLGLKMQEQLNGTKGPGTLVLESATKAIPEYFSTEQEKYHCDNLIYTELDTLEMSK